MVFISGPRQSGKTTLAKFFEKSYLTHYYNWDNDRDRLTLKKSELDYSVDLWILDEIHKNRTWRNWLKGLYDTQKDDKNILVTGSARLDIYRYGGDSLQGRFFLIDFIRLLFLNSVGLDPLIILIFLNFQLQVKPVMS